MLIQQQVLRLLLVMCYCGSFNHSRGRARADEFNSNNNNNNSNSNTTAMMTTNPYYSGCFHHKVPGWTHRRVCARNDPPSAVGVACAAPPFDNYLEIRVATGNWDSATALGWLTQIILSELVGVPSSMEAGAYGSSRDFYDAQAAIDYDRSNSAEPLVTATDLPDGDCRSLMMTSDNEKEEPMNEAMAAELYQPCAHFMPEYWGFPFQALEDQKIEPPQGVGLLGQESWFLTQFTAEQDPSLVSWHGLAGEENRHKLAATFKRPTTWQDYCEIVSPDNCTTPSAVAQRPPRDEEEGMRMFAEGDYTGHFRFTDRNNCTKYPTNCTGHIANYPCGWKSFMEANIYHLNIALDPRNGPGGSPGGYTTDQLAEMWHAANATNEALMMMWWTPEPLYQKFVHTPAAFQRVMLKPYTRDCKEGRNNEEQDSEECSENITVRVGSFEGACENPTETLRKVISARLLEVTKSPDIPLAAHSPAYDVLQRFQFDDIQLGELFDLMESQPTRRDAVCTWAVNNLEFLKSTIPPSYPRVTQEEAPSTFGYVSLSFGCLATAVVILTMFMVYQKRNEQAIQYAQLDFLFLLLVGSFFVCIGSILLGLPASDGTCLASIWFVYVGYTLELVPLIVKVGAINTMMEAARTLRRITLNREQLYRAVAVLTLGLVIYLAVWSALDPPQQETDFFLTEYSTDQGERIVAKAYFCSANSDAWAFVAVGWNAILLVGASVLAYQTRNTVKTFNESRTLAFLIYSHFVFVILRLCTFLLASQVEGTILDHARSLLYAIDQMSTCAIYFLPKITSNGQHPMSSEFTRSSLHIQGMAPSSGVSSELRRSEPLPGSSGPFPNANSSSQETDPAAPDHSYDIGNGTPQCVTQSNAPPTAHEQAVSNKDDPPDAEDADAVPPSIAAQEKTDQLS